MTVASSQSVQTALGNGATTVFSFPFIAVNANDIEVIYTDPSGNQTLLQPSQYQITLNPLEPGQIWQIGGNVTYTLAGAAPIPSGSALTIARVLPLLQNVSVSNQGNFYPQSVDQALDILCMEIQQIATQSVGSVRFPIADATSLNAILPPALQRANKYAAFDASGNVIAASAPGGFSPIDLSSYYATATQGNTSRTLAQHFDDIATVADLGARGDGTTDNYNAFTTANTTLNRLRFGPGEYYIGESIAFSVPVSFEPGAMLLIPNGVTVTFNADFIAGPYQVFSTSGTGKVVFADYNSCDFALAEWWGALPYGITTDCAPAINAALLAHTKVKLQRANYYTNSTILLTRIGNVLMSDDEAWNQAIITINSPTLDCIKVSATSYTVGNVSTYLQDTAIIGVAPARSVVPTQIPSGGDATTGACGIRALGVLRLRLERCYSVGNYIEYYFGDTVNVFADKCYAFTSNAGTGTGQWFGYYIDGFAGSSDGQISPNASTRFTGCVAAPSTNDTAYGFYCPGRFSDQFLINCETAGCSYGMFFAGTQFFGFAPSLEEIDLHIIAPINDGFKTAGLYINGISPDGQVHVNGGYAAPAAVSGAPACLAIINSAGVLVTGYQCIGYTATGSIGVLLQSVTDCDITAQAKDCAVPWKVIGANACEIKGSIRNTTQSATNGVLMITSSSRNRISVGAIAPSPATITNGYNIDSSCTDNECNMTRVSTTGITNKLLYNGSAVTGSPPNPVLFGSGNIASGVLV